MTKIENQNWSFLKFLPKSKVTSEFALTEMLKNNYFCY